MRVERIVSGGQTGVDRAGLDAAMEAGIPVGGWCPEGRLAEDGRIPDRYPVTELESAEYGARTEKNIVDSDATLVLNIGELSDGTLLTVRLAGLHGKPVLVLQLDEYPEPEEAAAWVGEHGVRVLNIAGPRESKRPGVYEQALGFMRKMLGVTEANGEAK